MKKFLFVLVVVGLVCVGCDSGSTGGGDKILGLPYSLKFDHKDNFGGECISYILDCSYDEAHKILTQKFGRDSGQVGGPQGGNKTFPANIAFLDYFVSNPNCVVLQDCVDSGAYRLWCDSSTYGGFEWEKPFERKGTLRITGIPAKHEGQIADFNMWYSLGMRGGEMAYDRIISSINKWSKPWEDNSYSVIKNGSVDIPLWWFPHKKYDRSGTYNHGGRYSIYLDIADGIPWKTDVIYRFPTVTFNNGSAELDFNTGIYDSTEHPK